MDAPFFTQHVYNVYYNVWMNCISSLIYQSRLFKGPPILYVTFIAPLHDAGKLAVPVILL